MNIKKSLENRIRGWLPQEPLLTSPRKKWIELRKKWAELRRREPTESERKVFKRTLIADSILTGSFSGTHILIDRYNENIGVTIVFWAVFVSVLVNCAIYWYYKRQESRRGVS
jgi:hypothetical protein